MTFKRIGLACLVLIGFTSWAFFNFEAVQQTSYQYEVSGDWAAVADEAVASGTLANGLKWYTKELEDNGSRDRIELRLRINAGSLQETDAQKGLAHFIEHMAFNGTDRFPKHEIVDFFEAAGMSFGGDINAHTSFDETVYKLTIPADKPELIDTGFAVLYDWATAITFSEDEVENEIPVIIEEWRSRVGTERSIGLQEFDILYANTRIGERLPLGETDTIKSANAENLKEYYDRWYRPDFAEVIVVYPEGALDAASIIESTFSTWPAKTTAVEVIKKGQINWKKSAFMPVSDSNRISHGWKIYVPVEGYDENTSLGRELNQVANIIIDAFGARLQRLGEQDNPVVIDAGFSRAQFDDDSYAFSVGAAVYEDKAEDALAQLTSELNRLAQYGLTETEFLIAKQKKRQQMKNAESWWEGTSSANHARDLLRRTKDDELVESYSSYREEVGRILSLLTLEKVNEYLAANLVSDNVLGFYQHPKAFTPDAESWLSVYQQAWQEEVQPLASYEEKVEKTYYQFPGNISDQKDLLDEHGLYLWTLENGIDVVLKPSDFETNRVQVEMVIDGGGRQMPYEIIVAQEQWGNIRARSGLEGLSGQDFYDSLKADGIQYSSYISRDRSGARSNGQADKLEHMFRLIAGSFTEQELNDKMIRLEIDSTVQRAKQFFETPRSKILTQYMAAVYGDDIHYQFFSADQVAAVNKEQLLEVQRMVLEKQQGTVVVIVGDVTPEQVTPLLEAYFAGLPLAEPQPQLRLSPITEKSQRIRIAGQAEQKTDIRYVYAKENVTADLMKFTAAEVMEDALEKRLHQAIREDSGLTYGTSVFQNMQQEDDQQWLLHIRFSTDPEREQEALAALDAEMSDVITNPFSKDEIDEAILRRVESRKRDLTSNSGINLALYAAYRHDLPFTEYDDYGGYVNRVTPVMVNDLVQELLSGKKVVTVHHP